MKSPLYDPSYEHDGCGIGFIADVQGRKKQAILSSALEAVAAMRHRGPAGGRTSSGDGAGIMAQIPRRIMTATLEAAGCLVPQPGSLGVGMFFLPLEIDARSAAVQLVEGVLAEERLRLLAWRPVPIDEAVLQAGSIERRPWISQCLIARPDSLARETFENRLYIARRKMERRALDAGIRPFYVPSFSSLTVVYKGLLASTQLPHFYADLRNPDFETAFAVFHQRFSTNTFPTWERAQPFRMLSHNGEINTLQGNVNWFRARESDLRSEVWGDAIHELLPVIDPDGSDSAKLDNVLELLVRSGREIPQALMMLVPQAWENQSGIDPALRGFHEFHTALTEPWDGPAALTFSDGRLVGAALDRNGLRPLRWLLTDDGVVYAGSEVGAVPLPPDRIVQSGRLGPGQLIAVDVQEKRLIVNDEIKQAAAARQPYGDWAAGGTAVLRRAKKISARPAGLDLIRLRRQQAAFCYTSEELSLILKPMVATRKEGIGSMGDDTPPAVLSQKPRPLFHYFRQRFAQVTNPPIDPLREKSVMSLRILLGPRDNLLEDKPSSTLRIALDSPILRQVDLEALETLQDPRFQMQKLQAVWQLDNGSKGLVNALDRLCQAAEAAILAGCTALIISDRGVREAWAPVPAVLAVGAVHHHLMRAGLRSRTGLISETGEAREVHHFGVLIGYGANAVAPYLALSSVRQIGESLRPPLAAPAAEAQFVEAIEAGLLKIMSKMGISTIESYCGAQIFECLGLEPGVVDRCFSGTPSRLQGIGFKQIAEEVATWHRQAFSASRDRPLRLEHPGFYKFRRKGEHHSYSPALVQSLHAAVGLSNEAPIAQIDLHAKYQAYREIAGMDRPRQIRDLLDFTEGSPIPIADVEPVAGILERFSSSAMSHGALSKESHETLAVAMNRLGGRSNSGEGGEAFGRYGTRRNSRAKQVASGRFGVTPAYLVSADELQIKMAQGSKPGEGGQLPGHKVTPEIAAIRHTRPGVALISPPPHHDIYSIEDLAQLIYDLQQINPRAEISVKLVSTAGVGTIAAGVVKAGADVVLISGSNGGTGASPLASIKHAGTPWELGLAETQQTLVRNGLRNRTRLRVDGGLMTGRDVVIAAMLGAEEYSFGSAVLVSQGCLMARACHLNTCPVGIATQREDLRAKFPGTPETVIAFLEHVGQEVREILASLGFQALDQIVGRTDLLFQAIEGKAASHLVLTDLLQGPQADQAFKSEDNPVPDERIGSLNRKILADSEEVFGGRKANRLSYPIGNTDRTVGAALAGSIARRSGGAGLVPGSIQLAFHGSAGQSFGAFLSDGMHLTLIGEANDYVGKGMAGGEIVVRPSNRARFEWSQNVIAGNTILYGATGGALYLAGRAGERFAVRNSGAQAVVEGIGDHGCEYMTGGVVTILGPTGRNFGAGMTGGQAFVLDEARLLKARHNPDLIEIQPLSDPETIEQLRAMIRVHTDRTGSPKGQAILDQFWSLLPFFWHVLPQGHSGQMHASAADVPTQPDRQLLRAETRFLERTRIDLIRPGARIPVSEPNRYDQLLEHISVHRWYLGEARAGYVEYAEAVESWYENVYLPRVKAIRERELEREFPERTEADLYLDMPALHPMAA